MVATVVTVLPALLVLAKFAFRDVLLTGDFGVLDARLRDVWHGHPTLVGPYSNGWNHPGPLFFYALAPLNALFRGASWTSVAGACLLHVTAVVLSARLAWRRGGLGLTLLILGVFALSTLGATDRLVLDPWNPHVAMPFFVLFVLQAWSVTLRDRWQLLGAVIVGTFLVQTHIGYAPLVLAAGGVMLVAVLVRPRAAGDSWARWSRPVITSVAVAVVLWLPPIWEQLTGNPGNMTLIVRYFRTSPEGVFGLHAGAGTFAALYRPMPAWLWGTERLVPLTFQPRPESLWWLLVPAGLLAVSSAVTVRRRMAAELRLVALVGVLTLVGVVALGRLRSGAWSYMSLWRIPLAILVVTITGWTLWRAWVDRPPALRTVGIVLIGAVIFGGTLPVSRDVLRTEHVASFHEDAAAVFEQVRDRRPPGTVLVRNVGTGLRGVAPMIVDRLDRAGVDVRVDPGGAQAWGTDRTAKLRDVDRVWIVTEDGTLGSLLRAAPGGTVVARTSPLPAARERELSRLQRSLAQDLEAAGRPDLVPWLNYQGLIELIPEQVPSIDRARVDRVAALVRTAAPAGGFRCTVITFRPDALPGALAGG